MALNVCACTGVLLRDPQVRCEGASQQTTFTVRCDEAGRDGLTHPLCIPVVCYGTTAEDAATLPVGAVLAIEGKLMWKKTTTRTGEATSGLAVLAWQVAVLGPVPTPGSRCHAGSSAPGVTARTSQGARHERPR